MADEHKITLDFILYLAYRKYTAKETVHKKKEVNVGFQHQGIHLSKKLVLPIELSNYMI